MKRLDITGQVFGSLVAIEKIGSSKDGSVMWKCLCNCGNTHNVSVRHLNRKTSNVKSCGCLQRKSGKNHPSWTGHEKISGKWWASHIKHSGNFIKRKHVILTLTKEEAWELFTNQDGKCFFTDEVLIISDDNSQNTASLDRIDNAKGYDKSNVRWVNKNINMMRRVLPDKLFIDLCTKVANKTHV